MDALEKVSVDRNHGTGYDADYYKSFNELKRDLDSIRSELAAKDAALADVQKERIVAGVALGIAIPALIYCLTRICATLYVDCHSRN